MILPTYHRCFKESTQVSGRTAHTHVHVSLPQRPLDGLISFIYSQEASGIEINLLQLIGQLLGLQHTNQWGVFIS